MNMKYYTILNVRRDSDYVDIKKAYIHQATLYHYDEKRFTEISKAFEILSDPNFRNTYDKDYVDFTINFTNPHLLYENITNNDFSERKKINKYGVLYDDYLIKDTSIKNSYILKGLIN